jgi:hypothetical protein
MKKEIVTAVLLGLVIGTLIVGGIWTANRALQNQQSSLLSADTPPKPQSFEDKTPTNGILLSILSPKDLTLTPKNISIDGKTSPNTHIVIQTETDALYLKSDSDGTFTQEVNLSAGSNDLTVTAITDTGETSSKTITVVYSTTTI